MCFSVLVLWIHSIQHNEKSRRRIFATKSFGDMLRWFVVGFRSWCVRIEYLGVGSSVSGKVAHNFQKVLWRTTEFCGCCNIHGVVVNSQQQHRVAALRRGRWGKRCCSCSASLFSSVQVKNKIVASRVVNFCWPATQPNLSGPRDGDRSVDAMVVL